MCQTRLSSGRQPGDLGALRRVAEGVAEEARTRGFASPALAGFAFVGAIMKSREAASILGCTNVRYGSLAAVRGNDSLMAASERLADVRACRMCCVDRLNLHPKADAQEAKNFPIPGAANQVRLSSGAAADIQRLVH